MQVLFVLRFYHPDKTDKIDRLPCLEFKNGRKDEQCCQTAAVFTLVEFEVKKRFESCIQSIRVWI